MSSDTNILDCDQLRAILPHRYPFLMVDRVMLVRSENRAVGIKNVTINEPFFQGHFPYNPVMPGILILEAMVQTGSVVIHELTEAAVDSAFLKSVSKAKFRKPVFPGDRLLINTELIRFRSGIARLRATATVRDHQTCEAEFTIGIRENLPETLRTSEFAPDLYMNGVHMESDPSTDIHGVINIIPHRYPFILVDSILGIKDTKIFGLKNVTGNEPFFAGHFPKHAVMPETLLVEAMAQVGAVHVLGRPENKGKLGYFMAIDSARFRRPVRPGDQLVIEVETLTTRGRVGKARGRIYVGKEIVAETRMTFVIVNRIAAP